MIRYTTFNRFALRTPSLSYQHLVQFEELFQTPGERNWEQVLGPVITEAILIASPDLYNALKKSGFSAVDQGTQLSLYKYLNRMSCRSTPFGLFSALSIGKVTKQTIILLEPLSSFKKYARIDSQILLAFYQKMIKDPVFLKSQSFVLNETIYHIGDELRLISSVKSPHGYTHELAGVEFNQALELLFKAFGTEREYTFTRLCALLEEYGDVEEVTPFLINLIDSDVLLIKDHIAVIGTEILSQLSDIAIRSAIGEKERDFITLLGQLVTRISETSPGGSIGDIQILHDAVTAYFPEIRYKYPLQIDLLSKSKNAEVSDGLADEIREAVGVLNAMNPIIRMPGLEEFKMEFYKRYEEQEIPLSKALDVEMGIGFPLTDKFIDDNILISGINYNKKASSNAIYISNADSYILNKYSEYLSGQLKEISIDDYVYENSRAFNRLSSTILAQVELLSTLGKGNKILLSMAGGASAANFLTRFGYLDPSVNDLICDITRFEELAGKDCIVAEIAHLPQPRVANILLRPSVHRFEIPYGSNSRLALENRIYLDDIMISVRNGKDIVLRSKKLGKRILPKLTSAHNFQQDNLPVYQFLGTLQYQHANANVSFRWPSILEEKPFLPRVKYKNVVLALATWNFTLATTTLKNLNYDRFKSSFLEFAERYSLPARFFMINGDNRLLVNRALDISLKAAFKEVKKSGHMKCTEFLYDLENMVVKDTREVPYLNEMIFFYKQEHEN